MRPDDIEGDTITIRAGNTKTLKTRTIPVVPPLRRHLKSIPLGINYEGLKTGFRRAREAAEMPWVTFHDLRRSCATLMIQAGVDLFVVSKLLGHSSVAVTSARYAHLQVAQVQKGLRKTFGGRE
jgi:integrase